MGQDDDQSNQDSNLSQDQAARVAGFFRAQLELRVGSLLSDGLSDEQMSQFESFMNRDVEKVTAWIDQYAPDYEIDDIYEKTLADHVKAAARAGTVINGLALLADYAQRKWLSLNRPDYQEVVRQTEQELIQLVKAHTDAFIEAALQGTNIDLKSGMWMPPKTTTE